MKYTRTIRAAFTGALTLLLLVLSQQLYAYDLTVDRSQAASATNFLTVQAAINAAPTGRTAPYTIFIKNGRYQESILVPATKPFLQLVGESVANTVLTYNNSGGTIATPANNPNNLQTNGLAFGTDKSASFTVSAADFSAMNITFENNFGEAASNGQAVALLVNADRAAFRNCRMLGNQDTVYLKGANVGSQAPRQYFVDCSIEGNTDFLFGSSIVLLERCNIYAKVKATSAVSYIVVPNTPTGQPYGFVLKNCKIAGNPVTTPTGNTTYDLARPWNANPKAAFLNCILSTPLIRPEGWAPTSSAGSATLADSYFVEYNSTHFNSTAVPTVIPAPGRIQSGTGSGGQTDVHSQLTAGQAATYTTANILANASPATGSWDPCAVLDCVTPFTRSVIVNNLVATKGASTSTLTWNMSWPISGDVLTVYRATATGAGGTPGAYSALTPTVTEANDSLFNYTFTDSQIPAANTSYYYYVQGSLTPRQTQSDLASVTSVPTIVTTGTFGTFSQSSQPASTPGSPQSIAVSGTSFTSNVTAAVTGNYQVSLASSSGYSANAGSVTITASGTLASTPIYVRLNAPGISSSSGTLTLSATNAVPVVINLTGNTFLPPSISSSVLQQFTMQVDATDSTQARNARLVAPAAGSFSNLYLQPTTGIAGATTYSNKFGQVFSTKAAAPFDGSWSTGTPNRTTYQQFTITAAAGSTVRVDSLLYNAAVYLTSSNGRMAISYSTNGFTASQGDGEIAGGTAPGNVQLGTGGFPYQAFGSGATAFAKAFLVARGDAGPANNATNLYRVAIVAPTVGNPSGGVLLTGGQTLTVRFYFACGSSGVRPIFLKNVRFKGFADDATPSTPASITVSTPQTLSGNYNNVTVVSGGQATLTLPLTVTGTLTAASGGVVNTNGQAIVGAGSVLIGAGSELQIGDANGITASGASGSVQNTGTRSFSTDATYTYNGLTPNGLGINQKGLAQNTGTGLPTTVRGLTVNNGGTDNLATNPVTLSQATAVTQLVRLQKGTLASGGNLTLASIAGQGTALIDNTGGTVTGTGTMQRAFDVLTSDNVGYHQVSTPVLNPTIDVAMANQNLTLNPAYNTAVSATQVRPFPTVFGYDERRLTPANGLSGTAATSPATDLGSFDKGFFSPTTGNPMGVGKGFTGSIPNANVLNFTGTFNNGGYNINGLTRGPVVLQNPAQAASGTNTDQSGWQMIGNPYPSPLNAQSLLAAQFTNMGSAIYVFHATGRYSGAYSTYIPSGTGAVGTGSTARTGDPTSALIDAGSAFWVRVTGTSTSTGALALTNTNRVTTFGSQPVFGRQTNTNTSTGTRAELQLQLSGAGLTDAAHLYFDAQATAGVDARFDAPKLSNSNGLNLGLLAGTTQLAIDGRPAPTTATVLPLLVSVPVAGSYTLNAATLTGFTNLPVYLRDALTGTRTLLNAGTAYRFAMTTTTAPGRFALEFAPAGTALATAGQALAAQVQLYPNPAPGRFHVVLPAGAKAASATVTNALGQVVLTRTLTSNEADFSLATPGVYTLRLVVDGNAVARKVVVE